MQPFTLGWRPDGTEVFGGKELLNNAPARRDIKWAFEEHDAGRLILTKELADARAGKIKFLLIP